MHRLIRLIASCAVFATGGCAPDREMPDLTYDEFATQRLAATCHSNATCGSPAFASEAGCRLWLQDQDASMASLVHAGTVGFDPAKARLCIQALTGQSCAAYAATLGLGGFPGLSGQPADCLGVTQPKVVGNGSACVGGATVCGANSFCDTCVCKPRAANGTKCTFWSECAGLACIAGACAEFKPGNLGEPCDQMRHGSCSNGALCNSVGASAARCTLRAKEGEPCHSASDEVTLGFSNCDSGLICDLSAVSAAARKCIKFMPIHVHGVCHGFGCDSNLRCTSSDGIADGTCEVPPGVGEPCTDYWTCRFIDTACVGGAGKRTCQHMAVNGEACLPGQCADRWLCDPATTKCVEPPGVGQPCSNNADFPQCVRGASCSDGKTCSIYAGDPCAN